MSLERARELRRNATPPERAMWRLLKPFRDQGVHFRRQVQIGKYYADFASHSEKLVIEVDGNTHAVGDGPGKDGARTEFLKNRGFRVLRFSNAEVMKNPEGVFETIKEFLKHPPPRPSPQRGRGEVKALNGPLPAKKGEREKKNKANQYDRPTISHDF